MRRKINQGGFTLIELTIVMILLAILYTVFRPRVLSSNPFNLQSFAGVLRHDLLLTKAMSISHNARYSIVIGANSYQIRDPNGVAVQIPQATSPNTTYPAGITVTPATTIVFDSLGQPYTAGNVALTTPLTLTVATSGFSQTVSVMPQTGFIL